MFHRCRRTQSNEFRMILAVTLAVLVVVACAIRLRGDQDDALSEASIAQGSADPTAAKLEQCRSVQYEQKDALVACRMLWDEKRHDFFGSRRGSLGWY
ncbi:putative entry exclusion protein TrbK-alt [Bradyrhizobium stylosanthis]